MKAVFTFAQMTIQTLSRRKVIYGILLVMLLALIGLGRVPSYDISNQGRFILDFGLFGLEIGVLLLAIGLASNLFPKDRDSRIIMPLLAVPLSRTGYLLGRYLGAAAVQIISTLIGMLGLILVLVINGYSIPADLFPATFLLIVEGLFLLSVVFFFSFWTSPPLNAPLTVLLFIASQMSVREFIGLLPSAAGLMRILRLLLPHMDAFHIKDPIAHGEPVPLLYFLIATLYGLAYTSFMLSISLTVFRSRDMK